MRELEDLACHMDPSARRDFGTIESSRHPNEEFLSGFAS
jgi:hypothetical protein